ncbi:hypothetical protein HJD18_14570 [Thermoleophilia bacterium SCSIO 60948]|nr:hypothetical protein HJD18_14570 [Thermoleophilia bacterium SCSIO 60948]
MALHGMQGPADRARPDRATDAEPLVEHRIIRRRERVIAEGSLVCPSCELPVLPLPQALGIAEPLECAFCGHSERASAFVRTGARDVPTNRISLVAELP